MPQVDESRRGGPDIAIRPRGRNLGSPALPDGAMPELLPGKPRARIQHLTHRGHRHDFKIGDGRVHSGAVVDPAPLRRLPRQPMLLRKRLRLMPLPGAEVLTLHAERPVQPAKCRR